MSDASGALSDPQPAAANTAVITAHIVAVATHPDDADQETK